MAEFEELWRVTTPGDTVNRILVDRPSQSVFVGDGWGVPYAALRLHRLDLSTGQHIADVRTRHQGTSALALSHRNLYAATDSRLFEPDLSDLAIRRQWDRGLVRFTMQLVPDGALIVAANWLMPTIGVFDTADGRVRRVRAGRQPLIVKHEGLVKVVSGFDGGLATLDTKRARLYDPQATVPIASAAAGEHIWGIAAGPPKGGQGDPPVWTKEGTDTLVRLTGSKWQAHLPGGCERVHCDDERHIVWCRMMRPSRDLVAVSQEDGMVIGTYQPPEGFRFHDLMPVAGVGFAMMEHRVLRGNEPVSTTSTCACIALPEVVIG